MPISLSRGRQLDFFDLHDRGNVLLGGGVSSMACLLRTGLSWGSVRSVLTSSGERKN